MSKKLEAEPSVLSKKDQLLKDFIKGRKVLAASLVDLEEDDLIIKSLDGYSVGDILAHIVEWDSSAIRNAHNFLEGKDVDFSPDEDNDAFNNRAIAKWSNTKGRQMVQMFNRSTLEVTDFIQFLTEEDLFCDRQVRFKDKVVTPAWFLVESDHDLDHARQIEDWKREVGIGGI